MIKSLKYRLLIAIACFLSVILVGIAGYMIVEGFSFLDALYMTVITISTVGYGETKVLHEGGRIFTIVFIVGNLVVVAYSLTLISSYFLEADLVKKYKINKMHRKINELQDHVILCGLGRTGLEALHILRRNNIKVVVVEKDENALFTLKEMNDQYYVDMDSTTNEALLAAGIQKAKALITTLPSDADNVFVTLTASELRPGLLIVSRATNVTSIPKLKRAGAANVIMPYKIGGAHMASLVVNPDVKEFIDVISGHTGFNAHIEEIDLSEKSNEFQGKSLGEIGLHEKTGVNIIGLKTGEHYVINPEDSHEYKSGQKLLVIGNVNQFQKLKTLMSAL